jgi:archaellum component FlaC
LGHYENLLDKLNTAKKYLNGAKKAIKYKMQAISNAQSELNAFNEYVNYFEINTSEYVGTYENIDKMYSNVSNDIETFINSDDYKNWLLNTEKRKNDEIAKQLIKLSENIQKFRNFELMYVYGLPYNLLRYNKEQNEVQTSSGVKISLPVFMRYYNKLKNNELNKGEKIEHYTYLGKDDKTVFVGCHTIELKEIENLIRLTDEG